MFLAGLGRDVTIMELLPELNDGGNMVHFNALKIEIDKLGIALALGTSAVGISEKGVEGRHEAKDTFYAADTVIIAAGQKPLWEEADTLRYCAPEFHRIGDGRAPRNILQATTEAYNAARFIGRL